MDDRVGIVLFLLLGRVWHRGNAFSPYGLFDDPLQKGFLLQYPALLFIISRENPLVQSIAREILLPTKTAPT